MNKNPRQLKHFKITFWSTEGGYIQDTDGEVIIKASDEEEARDDFRCNFGHPVFSYIIEDIQEVIV